MAFWSREHTDLDYPNDSACHSFPNDSACHSNSSTTTDFDRGIISLLYAIGFLHDVFYVVDRREFQRDKGRKRMRGTKRLGGLLWVLRVVSCLRVEIELPNGRADLDLSACVNPTAEVDDFVRMHSLSREDAYGLHDHLRKRILLYGELDSHRSSYVLQGEPPVSVMDDHSVLVTPQLGYDRIRYALYGNFSMPLTVVEGSFAIYDGVPGPVFRWYPTVSPVPILPPRSMPGSTAAMSMTILVPEESSMVLHVFMDVILSLQHSLSLLSISSSVSYTAAPRGNIVVAPHLLSSDVDLPLDTIVYNYEYVGLQLGGGSKLTADVLEVYRQYRVWDYSASNVEAFAKHGVSASLVPMAPHPGMVVQPAKVKDIPVLFYGTMTPHRIRIVNELRMHGITVLVPNLSNWGSYGDALDHLISRAEIILSLNTWDEGGEWKATRFTRLWASGCFVISERTGSPEEDGGGMVIADTDDITEAVIRWSADDEGRRTIAEQGRLRAATVDVREKLRDALNS